MIYAQIIKQNMRVNLIGDEKLGLHQFESEVAFTVDITGRSDVGVGMLYRDGEFIDDKGIFELTPPPKPISADDERDAAILDIEYKLICLELGVSK